MGKCSNPSNHIMTSLEIVGTTNKKEVYPRHIFLQLLKWLAQIDYVLTNKPWQSSVKTVHSTAHTIIESDHKLLVAKLAVKNQEKIVQAQISQTYRRSNSNLQQSDSQFFPKA